MRLKRLVGERRLADVVAEIGGSPAERQFWGVVGQLERERRAWRLACVGLIVNMVLMVGGFVALSLRSGVEVHVVEVDRHGDAVSWGPAEVVSSWDDRIVIAELRRFVRDLRVVTKDPVVQSAMVHEAYAHLPASQLESGSRQMVDSYFSDPSRDPRVLAQQMQRTVDVLSVQRVPGESSRKRSTWRIRWRELVMRPGGLQVKSEEWEAFATVHIDPPKKLDERKRRNILGVYVEELTWSRLSGGT